MPTVNFRPATASTWTLLDVAIAASSPIFASSLSFLSNDLSDRDRSNDSVRTQFVVS